MKKILALFLIAIFGVSALAFAAPASASESKKEMICHATASKTNPYNYELVARQSIINGGHGEHGVNADDIVPDFKYNFDGGPEEYYPGQNWTTENQVLWSNRCSATNNILTPILPTAPIITCADPTPAFIVPTQLKGINITSAADDKGNFTVAFELPKNTAYNTYSFPADFVNPVTISTVDNRPSDPMWSVEKGACNLPDTGVGADIQWWMIPAAAGGFLLAALLFIAKPFIGRHFIA